MRAWLGRSRTCCPQPLVGLGLRPAFARARGGPPVWGPWDTRRFGSLGDPAGLVAGIPVRRVAGSPGGLLGATAQPAWWHARRWLPRLFVASAASAGGGALELIPMSPPEERGGRPVALRAPAAAPVVGKAVTRGLAGPPPGAKTLDLSLIHIPQPTRPY